MREWPMNHANNETPPEGGAGVTQSRRRAICANRIARSCYPPASASARATVTTEESRAPPPNEVRTSQAVVGPHTKGSLIDFPLFEQLKKRNIFRVAALYVGMAYVLLEIFELFFHLLELPAWAGRIAVLIAVTGRPPNVKLMQRSRSGSQSYTR
jgi:hypothetical protein